jgi:hypothetical protein
VQQRAGCHWASAATAASCALAAVSANKQLAAASACITIFKSDKVRHAALALLLPFVLAMQMAKQQQQLGGVEDSY